MEIRTYQLARKLSRLAGAHVGEGSDPEVFRYLEMHADQTPAYGFGAGSPYALADLANIAFVYPTEMPVNLSILASALERLKGLQDPVTGLFNEVSHHPIHTTACSIAALARHDQAPAFRVAALDKYLERGAISHALDAVRWDVNPWRDSNIPVGIIATLVLTLGRDATKDVEREFFQWLDQHVDRSLGLWRRGKIFQEGRRGHFTHIAAAFHLLFLYDYLDREFPCPAELFEECCKFLDKRSEMAFNREPGYIEVDLFYCLLRAGRRVVSPSELFDLVTPFCSDFLDGLESWCDVTRSSDMHKLFGSLLMTCEINSLFIDAQKSRPEILHHPLKKAPYV